MWQDSVRINKHVSYILFCLNETSTWFNYGSQCDPNSLCLIHRADIFSFSLNIPSVNTTAPHLTKSDENICSGNGLVPSCIRSSSAPILSLSATKVTKFLSKQGLQKIWQSSMCQTCKNSYNCHSVKRESNILHCKRNILLRHRNSASVSFCNIRCSFY